MEKGAVAGRSSQRVLVGQQTARHQSSCCPSSHPSSPPSYDSFLHLPVINSGGTAASPVEAPVRKSGFHFDITRQPRVFAIGGKTMHHGLCWVLLLLPLLLGEGGRRLLLRASRPRSCFI